MQPSLRVPTWEVADRCPPGSSAPPPSLGELTYPPPQLQTLLLQETKQKVFLNVKLTKQMKISTSTPTCRLWGHPGHPHLMRGRHSPAPPLSGLLEPPAPPFFLRPRAGLPPGSGTHQSPAPTPGESSGVAAGPGREAGREEGGPGGFWLGSPCPVPLLVMRVGEGGVCFRKGSLNLHQCQGVLSAGGALGRVHEGTRVMRSEFQTWSVLPSPQPWPPNLASLRRSEGHSHAEKPLLPTEAWGPGRLLGSHTSSRMEVSES